MTKGEAANIIVRLKHGAQVTSFISVSSPPSYTKLTLQSRFEKKLKVAAKTARMGSKEKIRRAKEMVAVGPLST
jgi:ATP-dependent helicase IRC3